MCLLLLNLSHFACLCKEETVVAYFFVFLEEKNLDSTADSKSFQEKFGLFREKIDFLVSLQDVKLVIRKRIWKKCWFVTAYSNCIMLYVSQSRPALDIHRKHVGLPANWLNTSKSVCALKYFVFLVSLFFQFPFKIYGNALCTVNHVVFVSYTYCCHVWVI